MENLVKNMRILWRSERLVAEMELKAHMRKAGLVAGAILVFLAALAMADLALFLWLRQLYGSVSAGLIMAGLNLALGIMLLLLASTQKTGPETDMVREVRDMALEEIEAEAKSVQQELKDLRDDVRAVGRSVKGFAHDPIGSIAPNVLAPLLAGVLKGLTKRKKSGD